MHSLPPAKRRKLAPSSQGTKKQLQTIEALEKQLTHAIESNGSLNALEDLLRAVKDSDLAEKAVVSKACYAMYRVVVQLVQRGKLRMGETEVEGAGVVRRWIWERVSAFGDVLAGLLTDEEKSLRISALQILFSLLKHLSTSLTLAATSNPLPQFHVSWFKKIVRGVLLPSRGEDRFVDPDVRDLFVDTWLGVHDDVRWFFLREATTLLNTATADEKPWVVENLISLLERLTTFPTEQAELNAWWVEEMGAMPSKPRHAANEDGEEIDNSPAADDADDDDWRKFFDEDPKPDSTTVPTPSKNAKTGTTARLHTLTLHQSLHALPAHRAVFTRCWLATLQHMGEGEEEERRRRGLSVRVLNVMHQGVIPHLTRPVLVMDWVAGCVDYGGSVGLLGLNTLFVLMREYNLDYPAFYTRLYAFLDRDLLHLRHRARFFRMAELFLSSTHLPATILASFVKKLARLSLSAPPAAIITLVPFTYNILKRHPSLMGMIHRIVDADEDIDPFDASEPNPTLTNALFSSLWELHSHRTHHHPAVATLVRVLEEAFTKPSYALEDFLDHTYATLFENETKGRVRKEPAVDVDVDVEKGVAFPGKEGASMDEGAGSLDVVADLWTFS